MIAGLALVFAHPVIALVVVLGVSIGMALLVWWTWRKLSRGIRGLMRGRAPAEPSESIAPRQ